MGNVVAEVRRHFRAGAALPPGGDLKLHRGGDGGIMLRLRDSAVAEHAGENLVAPLDGVFRMDVGIVEAGAVHEAGQQRSLRQGEVLGRGVEEVAGRGFNAVGVPGEEHDVQVALEDLVLGVFLLQFDGELHLPNLDRHALLPVEDNLIALVRRHEGFIEHVGDVLLGQCGGALPAPAAQVGHQCPENPLGVDAGVFVEAAVLDRDDRILDVLGHLVEPDFHAVFRVEGGDRFPVGAEHSGRLRRRIHGQLRRKVVEQHDRFFDGDAGRGHGGDQEAGGQDAAYRARGKEAE